MWVFSVTHNNEINNKLNTADDGDFMYRRLLLMLIEMTDWFCCVIVYNCWFMPGSELYSGWEVVAEGPWSPASSSSHSRRWGQDSTAEHWAMCNGPGQVHLSDGLAGTQWTAVLPSCHGQCRNDIAHYIYTNSWPCLPELRSSLSPSTVC